MRGREEVEVAVRTRAIEEDFPFDRLAELARAESYRKNVFRPSYYLHKWWARRLGSVFRAIIIASSIPEGSDVMDLYYETISPGSGRILLDPFAGGGVIVGEALRLGYRVAAVDINPVSWFLVKKEVETVDVAALDREFERLQREVAPQILAMYRTKCPQCGGPAHVKYVYWWRLSRCESCGEEFPLYESPILVRHAARRDHVVVRCPSCDHVFEWRGGGDPTCPACGAGVDLNDGTAGRSRYRCPRCGNRGKILDSARRSGGPPAHVMVGIECVCERCGRGFKAPEEEDLRIYEEIRRRFAEEFDDLLIPRARIPAGHNTVQILNYGYRYWYQLFNERQLLALSTLLDGIRRIPDGNVREFFLLLFSGLLEFNSMLCSPKGMGTGGVRHAFAHHAYIPPKNSLEANVWGVNGSSGGFSTMYRSRLRRGKLFCREPIERVVRREGDRVVTVEKVRVGGPIEGRLVETFEGLTSTERGVLLLNKSAEDLSEIPDGSVDIIVTDPPYPGNVMYSELSNFFYAWLRLLLKDEYPAFATENLSLTGEIRGDPGGDYGEYEERMTRALSECHRVLRDDGLLVFTYHHLRPEGWDALTNSLIASGFAVVRIYPVHGEMDVAIPILRKRSTKFDVVLVCRKRRDLPPAGGAGRAAEEVAAAVEGLSRELASRLASAYGPSISEEDVTLLVLAAYSMCRSRMPSLPRAAQRSRLLERLARELLSSLRPSGVDSQK